jgi:hypothetical protein
MKTELNVLFKKMQKDDKKELLHFQIQGDEMPHAQELIGMAGGIVILEVDGCEAGEMTAEFATLQRDSKKTVLKFAIKGDSEDKAVKLYRHAGRNVTLRLQQSQMTIEEFYDDEHDGLEYTVNADGTVDVDTDQLSMDDVAAAQEADELSDDGSEKVADLEQERKRRGRPKKNAYAYPTPDESTKVAEIDEDALSNPDDSLPF